MGSISLLQGVSLKFPGRYKFWSCAVAFERFVFSLKGEPHQKNSSLCHALLSSKWCVSFVISHFRNSGMPWWERCQWALSVLSCCVQGQCSQTGVTRGAWPRESSGTHSPWLAELRVTRLDSYTAVKVNRARENERNISCGLCRCCPCGAQGGDSPGPGALWAEGSGCALQDMELSSWVQNKLSFQKHALSSWIWVNLGSGSFRALRNNDFRFTEAFRLERSSKMLKSKG